MLKKLSILLLTIFMVVPAMAQPKESCECMFAPKKGQWQIDLVLGQGQFFNDITGLYYLLPNADGTSTGIGLSSAITAYSGESEILGLGNDYISADLSTYVLNTGSLNANSLVNIAGLQGRYFVSNRFDINLMAAYNVNMQPHKDFIEGVSTGLGYLNQRHLDPSYVTPTVGVGDIYAQKAILGAVTHSLMTQIGSNYYFNVKNPRISPYLGIFGQFKMARIEAYYPYTGQTVTDDTNFGGTTQNPPAGSGDASSSSGVGYDDIAMYRASGRAGQVLGFGAGITAGVGYSISEGLILGFEVAPVCYQYSLMHLQVQGQDAYYAMNHNLRAFTFPQLKLGIRF
ncbi:MAG: BT1926 family outer membrane beta-barrel protein [Bacteroidales bacterium]|nr:BT1926 family outer membrane beta-barrel protein [Bacteroidales bacterium]MDD4670707.1 BT1926 family outer membrane beta-barrel protein [Bacteroidales bacterium]